MIAVLVTFASPEGFSPEKLQAIADNSRGKFEGLPGLRSKCFTADEDGRRARNFYVWDDEAAARGFFDDGLTELVTGLYGVAPSIEFLDVVGFVDNA
jgi:hypothetical protein